MDLASKVKMFTARVRSGSVKRMYTLAHDIHDEQGTPTPLVFLDMGWCILRYGIGYQEYRGYSFAGKPARLRRTFMTMNHNVALTREMCDRSLYPLFDDKLEFLKRYSAFAGRDWLDVREAGAEYVVMAGYMRMVGDAVLDAFPDRVVNLHPALLPSFVGAHAIQDAFDAGVKVTGVTVHFANAEYDKGPIIAQKAVPVKEGDTVDDLEARIHRAEHKLYPKVVSWIADERVRVDENRHVVIADK